MRISASISNDGSAISWLYVDGARGAKRGGKRAVREYTTGSFGAGFLSVSRNKAEPLLAPAALHTEPLTVAAEVGVGGLALLVVAAIVFSSPRSCDAG